MCLSLAPILLPARTLRWRLVARISDKWVRFPIALVGSKGLRLTQRRHRDVHEMKRARGDIIFGTAEAVGRGLARSGIPSNITIMPFTVAPGLYEVRAISHDSGHVFVVRGTDRRRTIRLAARQAKLEQFQSTGSGYPA